MKISKKLTNSIFLVITVFVIYFGIGKWAEYKIGKKIQKISTDELKIEYENVQVQLINGSVTIDSILIEKNKDLVFDVETISLNGISLFDLLIEDKLKASDLLIMKPVLIKKHLKKNKNITSTKSQSDKKFSVFIDKVTLRSGSYIDSHTSINNFDLELSNLNISDETIYSVIPFNFTSHTLQIKDLSYKINAFYTFSIPKFNSSNEQIELFGFSINPTVSRSEFSKSIKNEQDYMKLTGESLIIKKPTVREQTKEFVIGADALYMDYINLSIYRDKRLADDTSVKPLYSKMLRDLKFRVHIDSTSIRKSNIKYEEQPDSNMDSGVLEFNNLDVHISKISNLENAPHTKAHFLAYYMGQAPIELNWSFNILDNTDSFSLEGSIKNVKDTSLNSFLIPVTDVRTKGVIDEMYYNFKGNDTEALGAMRMRYDNFEIAEASSSSKGIVKILTSIADVVISDKEAKGSVYEDAIKVKRDPTKSFWNYLWLCIKKGMIKTMI
ncbi:hypothetical protein [uncultured Aquimarina sp.]|uniref:hypothetical protein n=1 Tax=uncultured Aquimarina sp. TaxID=575652 RepID=UPI002634F1C2|nr:hypothetical protein [uncultured Aquimarina sp.]